MRHKMVIIGAGSAMFTQGIVLDWLRQEPEGDWEIALVDIDGGILEATEKMVRRLALSAQNPFKILATTERKDVLEGATVVVCTIGVGGRRAWEQDVFVPRKYGIFQPVGDAVMPGGVSRAMRMIPAVLGIAKDVERLCPDTLFLNYANPMTAIVRAVRRETSLGIFGLCIGVDESLHLLSKLAEVPYDRITATWTGINHLTWILDVRESGSSLWPVLKQKIADYRRRGIDPKLVGRMGWAEGASDAGHNFHDTLFSWELYEEFGAFPALLDRHVIEFFPERFPGGRYYGQTLGVEAYSFELTIAYGTGSTTPRFAWGKARARSAGNNSNNRRRTHAAHGNSGQHSARPAAVVFGEPAEQFCRFEFAQRRYPGVACCGQCGRMAAFDPWKTLSSPGSHSVTPTSCC